MGDDEPGMVLLATLSADDKSKSGSQDIPDSLHLVGSAADALLKGDHQKKAECVSKDLQHCRKEAAEAQKICRELNGPDAPKIRIAPLVGVFTEEKPIKVHVLVKVLHICPKGDDGSHAQEEKIVSRKELKKRLKWLKAVKAKGDSSADFDGDAWEAAASRENDKDSKERGKGSEEKGEKASEEKDAEDYSRSPPPGESEEEYSRSPPPGENEEACGETTDDAASEFNPASSVATTAILEDLPFLEEDDLIQNLRSKVEAKDAEIDKLTSSLRLAEASLTSSQEFSEASTGFREELAELRKAEEAAVESATLANDEVQSLRSMSLGTVDTEETRASVQSEDSASLRKVRKSVTWSAVLASDEAPPTGEGGAVDKEASCESVASEISHLKEELNQAQCMLKLQAATVKAGGKAAFTNMAKIQAEEVEEELGQVRAELFRTRRHAIGMGKAKDKLEVEVSELQKVSRRHDEMKVQYQALSDKQASTSRRLEDTAQELVEEKAFRNSEAPHLRGKVDFAEQEVSAVLRRLALAESEAAAAGGGWAMPTPVPPNRLSMPTSPRASPTSPRASPPALAVPEPAAHAGSGACSPSPRSPRGLTTAEAAGAAVPSRNTEEAKQKADQLLHVIADGFDGLLCNVESLREGMERRKNAVLA